MRPSFIISVLSGIIIFIAIILFILNFKVLTMNTPKFIELLVLIGIAFGLHGISHYYEEIYFNFNPLTNNWIIYDKKQN